jgi:hypothetical protein
MVIIVVAPEELCDVSQQAKVQEPDSRSTKYERLEWVRIEVFIVTCNLFTRLESILKSQRGNYPFHSIIHILMWSRPRMLGCKSIHHQSTVFTADILSIYRYPILTATPPNFFAQVLQLVSSASRLPET